MTRATKEVPRRVHRRPRKLSRQEEQEIIRLLRAFEEAHVWIDEHHEELLAKFPEQWVAVEDGRVIASDPDPMALRAKLVRPADTAVHFITGRPMVVNL